MNQKIIDLTKDLIKIHSYSSNIEKLHEIVDYVYKYFEKVDNVIIKKFEYNNKPSIVVQNFDWKYADVVLNWHLDVVPPSQDWQFEPYEKDWILYGRWAWDMKSWVAIMMQVMKTLLEEWFRKKNISLILTSDEEVWWFDWIARIIDEWYSWEVIFIPDSWGYDEVVISEKWLMIFKVKSFWKAGHSSRKRQWENAVENIINFFMTLKNMYQNDKDLYSWDNWANSISLNMIKWWTSINTIPWFCEATFDLRFIQEYRFKEISNEVIHIAKKFNCKVEDVIDWECVYTDPENEHLKRYIWIVERIIWNKIHFKKEHWWSDWRYFAKNWSSLIYQRPTCWNLHWKDEWVNTSNFESLYKAYLEFIRE